MEVKEEEVEEEEEEEEEEVVLVMAPAKSMLEYRRNPSKARHHPVAGERAASAMAL